MGTAVYKVHVCLHLAVEARLHLLLHFWPGIQLHAVVAVAVALPAALWTQLPQQLLPAAQPA